MRSGRVLPVHRPVVRAGDLLPRRVAGGAWLRRHAAGAAISPVAVRSYMVQQRYV